MSMYTYDPKDLKGWEPKFETVKRADIDHLRALLAFTKRLGELGHPHLQGELLTIVLEYLDEKGEEENG